MRQNLSRWLEFQFPSRPSPDTPWVWVVACTHTRTHPLTHSLTHLLALISRPYLSLFLAAKITACQHDLSQQDGCPTAFLAWNSELPVRVFGCCFFTPMLDLGFHTLYTHFRHTALCFRGFCSPCRFSLVYPCAMAQLSIHPRIMKVLRPVLRGWGMITDILWIDKLSVSEYRIGQTFCFIAIGMLAFSIALNAIMLFITLCRAQREKLVSPAIWSSLGPIVMLSTLVSILDSEMVILFPWTRRKYGSCLYLLVAKKMQDGHQPRIIYFMPVTQLLFLTLQNDNTRQKHLMLWLARQT